MCATEPVHSLWAFKQILDNPHQRRTNNRDRDLCKFQSWYNTSTLYRYITCIAAPVKGMILDRYMYFPAGTVPKIPVFSRSYLVPLHIRCNVVFCSGTGMVYRYLNFIEKYCVPYREYRCPCTGFGP